LEDGGMNWVNIVLAIVAALAALVTYQVKNEVSSLNQKAAKLERLMVHERERIEVQRAEWAYLNTPARLERLASQHLGLQTLATVQTTSARVIPKRPEPVDESSSMTTLLRMSGKIPLPVSRSLWVLP
jgi:hypothetical protein